MNDKCIVINGKQIDEKNFKFLKVSFRPLTQVTSKPRGQLFSFLFSKFKNYFFLQIN